jgi:flagellar biogenesis protein FliO
MIIELVKTLFALVAVLGLMFVVVFALKKFFIVGPKKGTEVVDIEILSQRMLQPKRQLYVVKVMNTVLVLGSTEHGIHALGEINDESAIRSLEARQEELRQQVVSSRSRFKQHLCQAETLGDFFHKPFNVILWRGEKQGIAPAINAGADTSR